MIEFKGAISDEVRKKEINNQAKAAKIRFLILSIASFLLLLAVVAVKYLFSENKPTLTELFSGNVTMFLLLLFIVLLIFFVVSLIKPMYNKELDKKASFSIKLDNDKIVYESESGFGKREMNYSNLKKIVDQGSYYLLISKEHNIRLICEKDLLVQGSIEEFDNYFSNIIVRKNNEQIMEKHNNKAKNLEVNNDNIVEKVEQENKNLDNADVQNTEETKTFTNAKFKGSKTKNEKSFKFALIGIILGVLSVALTPIVVEFGINFAVNAITSIFNNLFYGGFVVEFFTFIFACMFVLLSAVILFPACILLTPVMALLSLIFPIYQLAVVNRRWFSWVALAVGILCIGGCLIIAVLTLQTF